MLYLIIEIPNIPLQEGEKAITYISEKIKNFSIEQSFIWKDGFAIFWENKPLIVKGPKISEKDKEYLISNDYNNLSDAAHNFIKKHLNLYKVLENSDNFYEENNILYFTTYQQFDLIKLVKNIPWIKPMKILNDFVTRPVKKIYLSYTPLEDIFTSVKPQQKNFTIDSFKEFYKQKGILVDFEEKIQHIKSLNIFDNKIIESFYKDNKDLIHNTTMPHVVFIPLKDKYKILPDYLVDFIISLEQRVISVYEENNLVGFNFIIDKKIDIDINKFSIVIDSRLEDLHISYERDKKIVLFNNNYNNPKLWNLMNELNKYFALNLDEEILKFIMNNLKNDFNTTLVEEYHLLGGVLSGLIYKDTVPNYNVDILNGFLSLNGIIKNNYGLLIYISEKLNFLMELDKHQLATSTKDPFATKDMVDRILELLQKNKLSIPYRFIPESLQEFIKKRFILKEKA
jgi:hypothetical protein